MKNEAWVFSVAGQQNEDAMGQIKFSPNERFWNRKKIGFSNTEKNSQQDSGGITLLVP